jgi:hypothetical protein
LEEDSAMDDENDDLVQGRTRWRRFILTFVLAMGAVGVLLGGMANGAIAASFTISGGAFKISADQLHGTGAVQYGSVDQKGGQATPVLVVGFRGAQMDNFCQSVVLPSVPGVGEMTIRITTPDKKGFAASNLLVGIQDASGNMTLTNVEIGADAGALTKGPPGGHGTPGSFGIQSDELAFDQLRQVAVSTTAGTLQLNQVRMSAEAGRHECF